MCYHIQRSADIRSEILRITSEQIAQALKEAASRLKPADKVHNVRRCLKRIRSILKLFRSSLSPQFFDHENQRFRDIGRVLAPTRDFYVTLQTFEDLKLSKKLRRPLQETFSGKFDKKTSSDNLAIVENRLREALKDVTRWPVPRIGAEELAGGLRCVYRDARKAFQKARKSPTAANLHRWRQKIKVLEHSLRLVELFCSKSIRRKAKKTDVLADALGSYHDLYLLTSHLEKLESSGSDVKKAIDRISKKSAQWHKCAQKLGCKFFNLKPAAFQKKYRSLLS